MPFLCFWLLSAQEQRLGLGSIGATSCAELAAAATTAAPEAAPGELECLQPAADAGLGSPTAGMAGGNSGSSTGGAFAAATRQLTAGLDQQVGPAWVGCFIDKRIIVHISGVLRSLDGLPGPSAPCATGRQSVGRQQSCLTRPVAKLCFVRLTGMDSMPTLTFGPSSSCTLICLHALLVLLAAEPGAGERRSKQPCRAGGSHGTIIISSSL